MPASEFLPIVPVGDLGGPGQISGQGGRATGIECRSGILLTAYAVGSHHTGTFPAGCGCPAALEKHWLVSLKKGTGRRCVEGGNSPVQGARAMGVSSGEPLGASPAPALGPSPSRPACGLGARCGFETQPAPVVLASFHLAVPSRPGAYNQPMPLPWETGGGASHDPAVPPLGTAPESWERGFRRSLVRTCS